jgi:hypothetical protein
MEIFFTVAHGHVTVQPQGGLLDPLHGFIDEKWLVLTIDFRSSLNGNGSG